MQVQNMMADPAFKAQAEQAAQAMKGGGMDFSALAQQMGATMGGGGGGGGIVEAFTAFNFEKCKKDSINVSVSGRGINVSQFTYNGRDQNSCSPVK